MKDLSKVRIWSLSFAIGSCVAVVHASQYCPPLADGEKAAVPTEDAAMEAARPAFVRQLTEQGYVDAGPFHARLHGDTWTVTPTTLAPKRRVVDAITVCRANGWLGYLETVVD